MKKILILILSYLLFNIINISSSFSSDVDKVRDLANSKPFVIEDKTASQLANQFYQRQMLVLGGMTIEIFILLKLLHIQQLKTLMFQIFWI